MSERHTRNLIRFCVALATILLLEVFAGTTPAQMQQPPVTAETYFSQGVEAQSRDHLAEAVEPYRRAIQLRPDFADAYFNLGLAYSKLRQYPEALAALQKLKTLRPESAEGSLQLAYAYF